MRTPVSALALSAALLGSAVSSDAARAAALVEFDNSGSAGTTYVDYSADQLVSFDLLVHDHSRSIFVFAIDAADVQAGSLAFNAIVQDDAFLGLLSRLDLSLTGASFSGIGTVSPSFGTLTQFSRDASGFHAQFSPAESGQVFIGDPTLAGGARIDWTIDLAGLSAGDRFSITVSNVPEPSALALLALGGSLFGALSRRRTTGRMG